MSPWTETTPMARFIQNEVIAGPPTFNALGFLGEDDTSLAQAIQALQGLCGRLSNNSPLRIWTEEVLRSCSEIQAYSAKVQPSQMFDRVQALRSAVLWIPFKIMQNAREIGVFELVVIAHLYAAAFAVDASIPEFQGAALGRLVTRQLRELGAYIGQFYVSTDDPLIHFPGAMIAKGVPQQAYPLHSSENLGSGQQSPYGLQNLNLGSAPSTPGFPERFPMLSTHSTEDLSVPGSPFLSNYAGTPSHRQSLIEHSPRPGSITSHGRRSFSPVAWSARGDSPAYSPAMPVWQGEDEQGSLFAEPAAAYTGGFVPPTIWT